MQYLQFKTGKTPYVIFVALALLCSIQAGCTSHPKIVQRNAEVAFTTVVDSLNAYRRAALIDDDTWNKKILPAINEGDKYMDLYVKTVDPNNKKKFLEKARAVITQLILIRYGIEAKE